MKKPIVVIVAVGIVGLLLLAAGCAGTAGGAEAQYVSEQEAGQLEAVCPKARDDCPPDKCIMHDGGAAKREQEAGQISCPKHRQHDGKMHPEGQAKAPKGSTVSSRHAACPEMGGGADADVLVQSKCAGPGPECPICPEAPCERSMERPAA